MRPVRHDHLLLWQNVFRTISLNGIVFSEMLHKVPEGRVSESVMYFMLDVARMSDAGRMLNAGRGVGDAGCRMVKY